MYERTRTPSSGCTATAKMAHDIGPRKTMFVLVVVVGCFAILWPKVFYPMLVGSANQHIKPSPIDKTTGCCDVFSETDINTIKIMSELCSSIVEQSGEKPLSGKEIVSKCKAEVQKTCGIDISAVLQEQIRLGRSVKQILSEVRSLNGSLCLKYHYGVAPWRLGVPHRITVNFATNVPQERPPHMRPDTIHPAFRERGSAIPRPSGSAKKQVKIVEGRPGPIPGMRPTLGGAGRVVPPSQKSGSSMSVIMPIYTIGIVIFFTYTLMKLLFKKQPDGVGGSLYPPVEPDPRFRKEVFESERYRYMPRLSRDPTGKIGWKERDAIVNAMSALLDEVNGEIEARRRANLFVKQAKCAPAIDPNLVSGGSLANGNVSKQADREQTSVKILGMETTASCEGGQKWNKPVDLMIPVPHPVTEPKSPPQEIYLQGALPAQSQLLVSDSAVVTESGSDPAVVLAGKMTLSVISMDNAHDNGINAPAIPSIAVQTPEMVDFNGDSENIEEESKYTTASSATVAENEISEDEGTDNEGIEEDIERINDLEFEANHVDVVTNGFEELPKKEEIEDIIRNEAIEEDVQDQIDEIDIVLVKDDSEEIKGDDVENFEQVEKIDIGKDEETIETTIGEIKEDGKIESVIKEDTKEDVELLQKQQEEISEAVLELEEEKIENIKPIIHDEEETVKNVEQIEQIDVEKREETTIDKIGEIKEDGKIESVIKEGIKEDVALLQKQEQEISEAVLELEEKKIENITPIDRNDEETVKNVEQIKKIDVEKREETIQTTIGEIKDVKIESVIKEEIKEDVEVLQKQQEEINEAILELEEKKIENIKPIDRDEEEAVKNFEQIEKIDVEKREETIESKIGNDQLQEIKDDGKIETVIKEEHKEDVKLLQKQQEEINEAVLELEEKKIENEEPPRDIRKVEEKLGEEEETIKNRLEEAQKEDQTVETKNLRTEEDKKEDNEQIENRLEAVRKEETLEEAKKPQENETIKIEDPQKLDVQLPQTERKLQKEEAETSETSRIKQEKSDKVTSNVEELTKTNTTVVDKKAENTQEDEEEIETEEEEEEEYEIEEIEVEDEEEEEDHDEGVEEIEIEVEEDEEDEEENEQLPIKKKI